MTNRMSIARDLFPDTVGVDLCGAVALSTSSFKELTPLDTNTVAAPEGTVFVSSTSDADDLTTGSVQEQLTETYIMPSGELAPATPRTITYTLTGVAVGTAEISLSTTLGTVGSATVSVTEGMTAEQIAAAVRAVTLDGFTVSGDDAVVVITKDVVGNTIDQAEMNIDTEGVITIVSDVEDGTYEGGSKKEYYALSFDVTSIVAGTMVAYFNSETGVDIVLDGTEDAVGVIGKVVAVCPETHTASNMLNQAVLITHKIAQANVIHISIDPGTTGVVVDVLAYEDGVDPTPDSLIPGNISVFYNSETPTLVAIDGTEADLAAIYEKIALSVPTGYTATHVDEIVITKTAAEANVIPLSIDLGTTGLTVDSSTLIPGKDEVGSTGAWTVQLKGISTEGKKVSEVITMNGQEQVESVNEYSSVLSATVLTTGTGLTNAGDIYVGTEGATTGKPDVGHLMISTGYGLSSGSTFDVPVTHDCYIETLSVFNPADEVVTVRLMSDSVVLKEMKVGLGTNEIEFIYPVQAKGHVAISAKSTSTTPTVTANISGLMVRK